jgi:REP element-mobilizing transposase RayT
MPQSLVKNYIHLIFSTKGRAHSLHEEMQMEMFRYIAGICVACDCLPVEIGGYTNHIHALFLLSKKLPLIKIVEEIKSYSSKWIKQKGEVYQNFYWQGGYGAFSINPSEVDMVIDYIRNQKEHHRKKTFEEEYRAFLTKYGVDFDERYVWD